MWFDNDPALVEELVSLLWLTGDEKVQVAEQSYTLRDALTHHLELTQNTLLLLKNMPTCQKTRLYWG